MTDTTLITRATLALRLAKRGFASKKLAHHFLESVLTDIAQALSDGKRVQLQGFGTFNVVTAAARHGRQPVTGERFTVPVHRQVKFAASKNLLKSDTP